MSGLENKSMESLVSVIIPSYNHGKYISDAIDSVISQTYKNWEIIVVDNFSTDNTDEILEKYINNKINIKVEKINNKNIIARSRNKGLKAAAGEYIAFLDSDDAWLSNKLEEQLKICDSKNADAVFTNFYKFDDQQCFIVPSVKRTVEEVNFFDIFPKKNIICQSSVLLKSKLVNEIGYINEDIKIRTIEDYDYWLRILDKKYKFIFYDKPLVLYRKHDNNLSNDDYQNIKKHFYHFFKYNKCFESVKNKNKIQYIKILLKKYIQNRKKYFN